MARATSSCVATWISAADPPAEVLICNVYQCAPFTTVEPDGTLPAIYASFAVTCGARIEYSLESTIAAGTTIQAGDTCTVSE